MRKTILLATIACCTLPLCACVNKGITKPHSEVVADAKKKGVAMPSAEDERREFFAADDLQHKRLMQLVRRRSNGQSRDSSYHIGPGDEIEVNVFDVPELNVTTRVRQSGYVALPLIGAVQAAGLTETDFHDELVKRLSAYVRQPQASVFITNYGSQKVAVLGAVARPGTYPLKKGANSILELVGEAGGVTEHAGNVISFIPAEVSGISNGNDVEARAKLALASDSESSGEAARGAQDAGIQLYMDQVLGTSGGIPLEIPVRGGDMIIVPDAGKIMVEGEVDKTGSYDLGRNMTLLGALAAAGGITYAAKVDEIEVVRDFGGEKKGHLVVSLERVASGEEKDVRLKTGDIVRVPSDSGRRLSQDTFEGISKIINFGVGGSFALHP
jgi:polysaccharide export outer membrane protein